MTLDQVQKRIENYFNSKSTEELKKLLIEKYGFEPDDFVEEESISEKTTTRFSSIDMAGTPLQNNQGFIDDFSESADNLLQEAA